MIKSPSSHYILFQFNLTYICIDHKVTKKTNMMMNSDQENPFNIQIHPNPILFQPPVTLHMILRTSPLPTPSLAFSIIKMTAPSILQISSSIKIPARLNDCKVLHQAPIMANFVSLSRHYPTYPVRQLIFAAFLISRLKQNQAAQSYYVCSQPNTLNNALVLPQLL